MDDKWGRNQPDDRQTVCDAVIGVIAVIALLGTGVVTWEVARWLLI